MRLSCGKFEEKSLKLHGKLILRGAVSIVRHSAIPNWSSTLNTGAGKSIGNRVQRQFLKGGWLKLICGQVFGSIFSINGSGSSENAKKFPKTLA